MAEDLDQFVSNTLVTMANAGIGIEAVLQSSPARWVLGFTDDLQMDVQIHEATNRIILSAEAGTVREENRLSTMEALLAFNLLWATTGCLRAGLAPKDPTVILIADLGLPDLTDDRLARLIGRLAETARQWRAFVAGEMTEQAEGGDDINMIKV